MSLSLFLGLCGWNFDTASAACLEFCKHVLVVAKLLAHGGGTLAFCIVWVVVFGKDVSLHFSLFLSIARALTNPLAYVRS